MYNVTVSSFGSFETNACQTFFAHIEFDVAKEMAAVPFCDHGNNHFFLLIVYTFVFGKF